MAALQFQRVFIRLRGFHILGWLVLSQLILLIYYDPKAPLLPQGIVTLIVTALCALPAYYGAYRLVPRFLYKKRLGAFVGLLLLTAMLNCIVTLLFASGLYYAMTGIAILRLPLFIAYFLAIFFVTNMIAITISCAIKIIADSFRMEVRLIEAEAEKLTNELAFLRSQVNPHFLFNVLNTIYFQIHQENAEARTSVEQLSELLRYQLYECTSDLVSISKEIAYIENYVSVQRLRMEHGTDVVLNVPQKLSAGQIAPLLILPLVENAFKHISHYKNPALNKLHISLSVSGQYFVVHVMNTCDKTIAAAIRTEAGGLGLKNVKRRLELLYPNAHSLDITKGDNTFETTLQIQLS